MAQAAETGLARVLALAGAPHGVEQALGTLHIEPSLFDGDADVVTQAQMAMALNVWLFADLLSRVPTAARIADDTTSAIVFDHGALRTIDGPTGALPSGHHAFARLLEPLGYVMGGIYPLPRLRMTGRAYVHAAMPEDIPQFFVSELHIDQLKPEARSAAERVFGASSDPLPATDAERLTRLSEQGFLPMDEAAALLRTLASAFDRHHAEPSLTDYETLLTHSGEAAWIATEGNAFNHATTRVRDVETLATELKAKGYPLKATVEISANGRVRQTAILADKVSRSFAGADGGTITRDVPGSFYEFITRDIDPDTGTLDLTFDTGNATGIFAVTRSA
ncbi:DUF1338 family protein [uncultured Novosphingobium sp.]|uniref:2-oxoadipate dioxygenase/decarboxylase family protein n=1 Tax=uncultured Novosphingobium sp. TaxID=292277 RepID=UPI002588DA42|nr:DUF1338 family protein [uncultured Novosphingobium sp.]